VRIVFTHCAEESNRAMPRYIDNGNVTKSIVVKIKEKKGRPKKNE
jgi:hypothetical protein